MAQHISTHQLDIGMQIDELAGIERTKKEVTLQLIKKTLLLGINLGVTRQDLLSAVISADAKHYESSEELEFRAAAEADILLRDFCHISGIDLNAHVETVVKDKMLNFVENNYSKHSPIRAQ